MGQSATISSWGLAALAFQACQSSRSPLTEERVQQGLTLAPAATVAGDAYLGGGSGTIEGTVGGDLFVGMGTVSFAGTVGGNATINANRAYIAESAQVAGTLTYDVDEATDVPAGVATEVEQVPQEERQEAPEPSMTEQFLALDLACGTCSGWPAYPGLDSAEIGANLYGRNPTGYGPGSRHVDHDRNRRRRRCRSGCDVVGCPGLALLGGCAGCLGDGLLPLWPVGGALVHQPGDYGPLAGTQIAPQSGKYAAGPCAGRDRAVVGRTCCRVDSAGRLVYWLADNAVQLCVWGRSHRAASGESADHDCHHPGTACAGRTLMLEVSTKLYVGDLVEMRKVHPCGGRTWEVDRVGADIGMVCTTCGRRVLLPRRDFVRGVKQFIRRGSSPGDHVGD